MEKQTVPYIDNIFLFADSFISAEIKYPDGTAMKITIPADSIEGKSMQERYELINTRCAKHIACYETPAEA